MEQAETIAVGLRRGNVPVPLGALVGRVADLDRLVALVGEHRLVTVAGPGGVGKTRLAVAALGRIDHPTVDGPWMVQLAGIEDGALVLQEVAQTLGLTLNGGVDAIVDALADRHAVLLLDNCEHVVEQAAALAQALATAPGRIHVVATSREPLRVPGEVVLSLDPLRPEDAWRLFHDRATQALPGFTIAPTEEGVVDRIVADLDGLPLAIELAAARIPVVSLPRLASMLADRFEVLTEHGRTVPERHQTLVAAIEWSHRLLSPEDQALFDELSVFRDGFELDAVQGVCDLSEVAAVTRLHSLASKSMITTRVLGSGERRYAMLESLRQFGAGRLEPERAAVLRGRHARWFADLADTVEQHLRSADASAWLARVQRDQDNFRAAAEHALATGQDEVAVRIVGAQSWYWYRRGFVEEGRLWLRRIRDLTGPVDPWFRSRAGIGAAALAYLVGDIEDGMPDLRVGVEAAIASGDVTRQAIGELYFGYFETVYGDLVGAMEHFARAEELAASGEASEWAVAEVGMLVGQLQRLQGDPVQGLETTRRARARALATGHRWAAGSCGWMAAKIHVQQGELDQAAGIMGEVLTDLVADEDVTSVLVALHTIAAIATRAGLPQEGARLLGGVDAAGDRIGYHPESMDLIDSPGYRQVVLQGLPEDELATELARGGATELRDLVALAIHLTTRIADGAGTAV